MTPGFTKWLIAINYPLCNFVTWCLCGKNKYFDNKQSYSLSKRILILLFILQRVNSLALSQDLNKDNQLRNLIREYKQAEVSITYPGRKAIDDLSRNVSITSVKDKKVLISISVHTIDWFISQKFDYNIIERPDYKGIISAGNLKEAMDWQSYPTYTQYDSIMQHFAVTYPSICHLDTIGTSVNGRLVLALKISGNAGTHEDEPEVFYSSSIHGNETGGYVLMLHLADYLLNNYSVDTRIKNLVDNLAIWINPLANPDGSYGSGNTISASSTRANANGFDLNRNFPDPDTPYSTYHIEQKETLDMVKFMRRHKFVISANFHAGDEVVNFPWDFPDNKESVYHADDSWFYEISRAYADTAHVYSAPGYMIELDNGVTRGYDWYSINGGRQDFITWELQGREVTIELDYQYITPAANLSSLWQYNWRSLLGYLENALYGIHGLVKDLNTAAPVPAKIFISGHDIDNSQVYSDTLSGSFLRMLIPGTWNLTFSAKGYRDTTIYNVLVVAGQKTDLVVEMKSVTTIDTTKRDEPLLYPNPVINYMKAKLPENLSGRVNIKIINQSGMKVADYSDNFIFGYPLEIDVKGLSGGGYTIIFTNTLSGISYRSRFIVTRRSF
jgi:hypothetical protein